MAKIKVACFFLGHGVYNITVLVVSFNLYQNFSNNNY